MSSPITLNLDIYPPEETFEDMQQRAIGKVDEIISLRILGGFYYQPPRSALPANTFSEEEDVPTFHFHTDPDDQSNFGDAAALYIINVVTNNTNYTQNWRGWIGNTAYTLTFDLVTYNAFGLAYAAHKNNTLATGWLWKAAVLAATSVTELRDIFTGYGVTEEEITLINCMMFQTESEE